MYKKINNDEILASGPSDLQLLANIFTSGANNKYNNDPVNEKNIMPL